MPELPEIEILKKSLNQNIKSAKITKIKINNRNLRYKVPININKILTGKIIKNISRVAKYLIFHFNSEKKLLIHLGMSGTIHLIKEKNKLNKCSYCLNKYPFYRRLLFSIKKKKKNNFKTST